MSTPVLGLWVIIGCDHEYVASVSVQFKSKERGTRVKDRAKNGASKTAGRGGEERKETLADKPRDFENRPLGSVMPEFVHRHLMLSSAVIIDQYRPNNLNCLAFFPSFPSPSPLFHFLALVSFLARPKPRIPFVCLSVRRNQTETLATQARLWSICLVNATHKSLS